MTRELDVAFREDAYLILSTYLIYKIKTARGNVITLSIRDIKKYVKRELSHSTIKKLTYLLTKLYLLGFLERESVGNYGKQRYRYVLRKDSPLYKTAIEDMKLDPVNMFEFLRTLDNYGLGYICMASNRADKYRTVCKHVKGLDKYVVGV